TLQRSNSLSIHCATAKLCCFFPTEDTTRARNLTGVQTCALPIWIASDATGRAVGVLADLQGPKIRLGKFTAGSVYWSAGEIVRIDRKRGVGGIIVSMIA